MQTYTLCDLDNNQTRCYTDCRYQSSPFDHHHAYRSYVTPAWSPPVDDNSVTSGYEGAVIHDEFWPHREADRISAFGRRPLDVTYYFRCQDYDYSSADYGYTDDHVSVKNAGNWTRGNWKTRCRTFYADEDCFTRSFGSIQDDVLLDGRCGGGYLSTEATYMDMLSDGRVHPTWSDCEVTVPEDGQATGSRCRAPIGNGNRLMTGIETFKWMTVRRGASKCVQTG